MPNAFRIKFVNKQIVKAQQTGVMKVLLRLSFMPLANESLLTFNAQVKKFEKYIIAINPNIPNLFNKNSINIILIAESLTDVINVNFC